MSIINSLLSNLHEVEVQRTSAWLELHIAIVGNNTARCMELYNEIDDCNSFIYELNIEIEAAASHN